MSRTPILVALLLGGIASSAQELTLDRVMVLAKKYFRDSAELPMDVAVTTVVTDAKGKQKRNLRSTVLLVFKGYNQETGRFSFQGRSGWFNTGALRDSLSGDFAAFIAATYLAPKKDEPPPHHLEVRQPANPGEPYVITGHEPECPKFELIERRLFPKHTCGSVEFRLIREGSDDLMFQHFSLDNGSLPAPAKTVYFGDAQVTSFRFEVDFQKTLLPGDPVPFLLPKQTVTTIATDKGKIVITNVYTPRVRAKPSKS
jgi:hypothetical protein